MYYFHPKSTSYIERDTKVTTHLPMRTPSATFINQSQARIRNINIQVTSLKAV